MALDNQTAEWEKGLLVPNDVTLLGRVTKQYSVLLGTLFFMAFAAAFALLTSTESVQSSPYTIPSDESAARQSNLYQPSPDRINDMLGRFLGDWPDSGDKDRAAMARFFGFFKYEPAIESLRHEAARLQGESAVASLQALANMGDVDSILTFREVIRSSTDCEAVRTAASAIGQWQDDLSYSTIIYSLLAPRCEGPPVVAQVRALLTLRHPYVEEYLFLIHQVTTSSTARLAAAAALARRAQGPKRSPVEATLRNALYSVEGLTEHSLHADEQTILLALWGMGRFSARTCAEATEHSLALFKDAVGLRRRSLARIFLLASPPCFKSSRRKNQELLTELFLAADDEMLTIDSLENSRSRLLPLIDSDERDTAWVDWLVQLATRFTLWDQSRSVAQFAQAMEKLEYFRSVERHKGPSANLKIAPEGRVPKPDFQELESLAHEWAPSDGFDQYEFTPNQPEWWPEWLDITIDDGPRPRRLTKILEVLDRWGVRGTFFFIGVNVVRNWTARPDETAELLNGLLDSGHRIGYHSMSHDTSWFRHLQACTPKQIVTDIALFDTVMTMALGKGWVSEYGRLPGGMGRNMRHVLYAFDEAGLHAPVHWQIQNPAWGPASTSSDLRNLARKLVRARKPTIILVHEYQGLFWQLDTFIKAVEREIQKGQELQ